MTCNNKCIHYPVCEQKNYDFANIEECPYYYDASTVSLQDIYQEGYYDGHLEGYTKAINEVRPQGECRTCIHRDPEDKKCDCGELERQGCPFPVADDYFCKFYDKGGAK